MDETGVGVNAMVKVMRSQEELFAEAASRALPNAPTVIGLEGTLKLWKAGGLTITSFRAVKRVLLQEGTRTASLSWVLNWTHSFDVPVTIHHTDLLSGTNKKPEQLKSLIMVWNLPELMTRDLNLAFEGGWKDRVLDFDNNGPRKSCVFKISQDAGGFTSAWVVTCLNTDFVCSARYPTNHTRTLPTLVLTNRNVGTL